MAVLLVWAALVWAAPLLGLIVAGAPVSDFLDVPPRTRFVPHADFAWSAFLLFALPVAGVAALYGCALANARPTVAPRTHVGRRFPWWGWFGLALNAASWVLAWQDDILPPEWRRHVFTPLWLGYILVMSGLASRLTGRSLLTHRTVWFLALFPVSAGFWWLFEYLNQFAGNWHYVGIVARGDWDYFLQATLPFSTVLPAVASTWYWLRQFSRLDAMRLPPFGAPAILAWLALGAGLAALAGIGVWPDVLFSMLWLRHSLCSQGCSTWCWAKPFSRRLRAATGGRSCSPRSPHSSAVCCGSYGTPAASRSGITACPMCNASICSRCRYSATRATCRSASNARSSWTSSRARLTRSKRGQTPVDNCNGVRPLFCYPRPAIIHWGLTPKLSTGV